MDESEAIDIVSEDIGQVVVPGISEAEYHRIRSEALEQAKSVRHEWRQKGRGYIYCTSCDLAHGAYIPMNKSLVGISKDGLPIFEDML